MSAATASIGQADRSCGECSLCCKILGIAALDKPGGKWCSHCRPGRGCTIYEERPEECHTFRCLWLDDFRLGEEWKPTHCKFVIAADVQNSKIDIHADAGSPGAWRREPYISTLRQMAAVVLPRGGMVLAIDGGRSTLILPDRGIDLGVLRQDDQVLVQEVQSANSRRYEASVVKTSGVDGPPPGRTIVVDSA